MKTSRLSSTINHVFAYGSALVFVLPIYILVNLAVRPADDLSPAFVPTSRPTGANLASAWTQSSLGPAMVNSTVVTTISCLAIVIFATMAAYPLARSTAKLSNVTFYLFLIGLLLPFQVALLPLYLMMRDLNLLGTLWSLVILYTGLQMPFAIFLVTTFLRSSVPLQYEEAARIDGCGDVRAFVHVVVPLLRPVLGTLIILNAVGIWNDFFTPLLYLIGSHQETLPVAIYQFVGLYTTDWPMVFAGLIISMLPVLLFYLIFQRYVIHGFAGGLKG
ncbi:carbohydrate ABC transporter permease [Nonomuraea angiospora]|jgi:raffinose/stachyose/melibiose transport system permease protein|uniref:carbohydrate ABC transporter permease n=1 Tax=Nonomuraea TaxID=83681 RepID=UPI0029A0F234|nr:carbohydrate ABC transporter permease [Nonomuraea angiospora]MDX3104120.1 carbohydrate ABC transporter permease [Nonomuraea angiospora]